MRLTPDKAARIKACKGVYSLRDTARHFNVSTKTVHDAWHNKTHRSIVEAPEPPNIISSRISPEVIKEDGRILLERYNGDYTRAAQALGVSPNTLRNHLNTEEEYSPMVVVFG